MVVIKLKILLFVIVVSISQTVAAYEYRYNDGKCTNQQGQIGLNIITQEQLEDDLNGECGDFSKGVNLHFTASLERNKMINLRGAFIRDLSLKFIVVFVDLSGADLVIKGLGYHTVKGVTDQYSQTYYNDILFGGMEELNLGVGEFCLSDSSGC